LVRHARVIPPRATHALPPIDATPRFDAKELVIDGRTHGRAVRVLVRLPIAFTLAPTR